MAPRLISVSGQAAGQVFELSADELSVGRDADCAIVLGDDRVSRRHAVIRREGQAYRFEDAGSRHGSRVNGLAATSILLCDGDRIELGRSVLQFVDRADAPPRPDVGIRPTETCATETLELTVEDALLLSSQRIAHHPEGTRVARDLAALLRLVTELGSAPDVEAAQACLLDRLFDAVPADRGGCCLLPRGVETLDGDEDFASVFAAFRPGRAGEHVAISRTIARRVVADRVALLCNGVMDVDDFAAANSVRGADVRSVICVPMIVRGRLVGVLYLDSSARRDAFDADHLQFVTAAAATAGLALDTVRRVERLEQRERMREEESIARHGMIGASARMAELSDRIARAAASDATILVRGESGTGKELVAHAVHHASRRAHGPFIAINCAAIPDTLLESELFGHERGAFTGAIARKPGKVELADSGTLFLDEMGDLPLALQAKLLRALQQKTIERIGGTKTFQVDVRIVAATNVDLEAAVKQGRFRQDLYYRLNVVTLALPPLRERSDDVLPLARHFAAQIAGRLGRRAPEITEAAARRLEAYPWPGNVRELENAIERALVLGADEEIHPEDLPETLLESSSPGAAAGSGEGDAGSEGAGNYHAKLAESKRRIVRKALERSDGVVAEAARKLGIHVAYLHRLMTNLGLRE